MRKQELRRDSPWCLLGLGLLALAGCDLPSGAAPDLVWGVHGIKPGRLHKPRTAAFDSHDNLYLADLTDRIQVFDRDGKYLRGWSTPEFNVDGPSGLDGRPPGPAAGGRHPFLSRARLFAGRRDPLRARRRRARHDAGAIRISHRRRHRPRRQFPGRRIRRERSHPGFLARREVAAPVGRPRLRAG